MVRRKMLQSPEGEVLQGIAAEVLHKDQVCPVPVLCRGRSIRNLSSLDVRLAPVIAPRPHRTISSPVSRISSKIVVESMRAASPRCPDCRRRSRPLCHLELSLSRVHRGVEGGRYPYFSGQRSPHFSADLVRHRERRRDSPKNGRCPYFLHPCHFEGVPTCRDD